MTKPSQGKRDMINGNAVLIVIDIQKSTFAPMTNDERAIVHMDDYDTRMLASRTAIDAARAKNIPVIFIQEIHRANLVDFGRELDGDEDIHCLDSNPLTELAVEELGIRPDDYKIQKRRYSAFYGTDLEILLKGLKAQTLFLVGGLTDVCVHYTFVDGHQGDYYCRIIEDCVAGSSIDAHNGALRACEYLQTGAIVTLKDAVAGMNAHSNTG